MKKNLFSAAIVVAFLCLALVNPCPAQTPAQTALTNMIMKELIGTYTEMCNTLESLNKSLIEYINALIVECDNKETRQKLSLLKDMVTGFAPTVEKNKKILGTLSVNNKNAKNIVDGVEKELMGVFTKNIAIFLVAGKLSGPEEGLENKKLIEEAIDEILDQ